MPLTRRQSKECEEDWIICQSKSRPERQYKFNKVTGETRWLSSSEEAPNGLRGEGDGVNEPILTEPTTLIKKTSTSTAPAKLKMSSRTPAQDRLKRLESKLKLSHKEKKNKNIAKSTSSSKSLALKAEKPSTSGIALKESPSTKRSAATMVPPITEAALAAIIPQETTPKAYKSSKKSPKKRRSRSPLKSHSKSKMKRDTTPNPTDENEKEETELSTTTAETVTTPPSVSVTSTTRTSNGIINKMCRYVLKATTGIKKSNFKTPKNGTSDALIKSGLETLAMQKTLSDNLHAAAEQIKKNQTLTAASKSVAEMSPFSLPKSIKMTTPPPLANTPKNLVIPRYEPGSANLRLARLRKSLQQESSCNVMLAPRLKPCETPTSSVAASSSFNESPNNSIYQDAAGSSTNEEIEPMDWQPMEENCKETIEIRDSETSFDSSSNVKTEEQAADSTVSEYYEMVNENLLRYDAEKQQSAKHGSANKWLKDHYYFVLDTNVMLNNLDFLDDVRTFKLCGTKGTILYIPYTVLQELDKLKSFSPSDSVKLQTGRAIKYLNKNFQTKSKYIQAQSAIDERVRLINISSNDDSIINCCLQVQKHIEHFILLTEDINLRNKAMCNNFLVSTKSDLLSKPVVNDA